MAQVTSRVNALNNDVCDRYNSHRSPTWWGDSPSQLGVSEEWEDFGDWYGGIYNQSFRFPNITVPQGATITSAKVTFIRSSGGGSDKNLYWKIIGVDEDNTGVFAPENYSTTVDDARTRTQTSASVDWDFTVPSSGDIGDAIDTADITSIIQEIINRDGWSSGNALALYFYNDGTSNGNYLDFKGYGSYPNDAPILTVNYTAASASATPSTSLSLSQSASPSPTQGSSPSVSVSATKSASPSASISFSPSVSISASPSVSVSPSVSQSQTSSSSVSPSPSPIPPFFGMRITKSGYNALTDDDPRHAIFDSNYGTLKYYTKQTINTSLNAGDLDVGCTGSYTHNLGYYPYCEVYVSVYVGSSQTGVYEYCPFYGAGATIFYSANYKITTDKITVYGMISGVSEEVWHFDFIVFIYKNNLQLS